MVNRMGNEFVGSVQLHVHIIKNNLIEQFVLFGSHSHQRAMDLVGAEPGLLFNPSVTGAEQNVCIKP